MEGRIIPIKHRGTTVACHRWLYISLHNIKNGLYFEHVFSLVEIGCQVLYRKVNLKARSSILGVLARQSGRAIRMHFQNLGDNGLYLHLAVTE